MKSVYYCALSPKTVSISYVMRTEGAPKVSGQALIFEVHVA